MTIQKHYKEIDFGKLKPNNRSRFKGNWLAVFLRFIHNLKIGR
jgi:hypothetical protein